MSDTLLSFDGGVSPFAGAVATVTLAVSKISTEVGTTPTATHIATGLYKYELAAAEVNTLGELSIRLAKTGVYNDVRVVNIVAFDPYKVHGAQVGIPS